MERGPAVRPTLILTRAQVAALGAPRDYIAAVEHAFHALHAGLWQSHAVGHVPAADGGFHIKSAASPGIDGRVAIKINGNFPGNPVRNGMPTIQGCLVLADADNGRLLAIMDSTEITAQRTAAASAVAARYLARRPSRTLAFIGCGLQARYHLAALLVLDELAADTAHFFDAEVARAEALAALARQSGLDAQVSHSIREATGSADVVVASTPSLTPLLFPDDVQPGTFIAAVGADNPSKCEIAPALMACARVVPDLLEQAATMGDLCRALQPGALSRDAIHAELAAIVGGARPGRRDAEEIFVFDSTGTAIQDLAAAAMIYQRARERNAGLWVDMNGLMP
jgi:ornithine cyclodeaminase/alanine dehydrogenase-like protein (mu-crystallin family)